MGIRAKKLLLIGIDQAIPYILDKFLDEEILPNIKYLVDSGVKGEAYSSAPCDTPTNWATIATGAPAAVHGATSFYMHLPGEPLDFGLKYRSRTQLSKYCNAEYFWDVADRIGLIPFVINYPAGWYSNFKKGSMSLFTWSIPESLPRILSGSNVYSYSLDSDILNNKLIEVTNSVENIESTSPIFKASIDIKGQEISNPLSLEVFLFSCDGEKYDSLYIPIIEDESKRIIKKDGKSYWIKIKLDTEYGKLPCLFQIRIINMDPNGKFLKMQRSAVYNTKGWCIPKHYGEKLVKNAFGIDLPLKQEVEFMIYGKMSKFLQSAREESQILARAINYSKKVLNWDICYFHYHPLDNVNHDSLAYLYENSPIYTEKKAEKTWKNVRTAYKIVDEMVGSLVNSCVTNETIVVFVSDHGAIPIWRIVNIPIAFIRSGLLNYKWNDALKKYVVDWGKTSAFPYMEPPFVWVNLKNRDPNGAVAQKDYEDVRDKIIETLYDIRDPETNKNVIQLALKREETDKFGLNGERIGDVVYFLKPPYGLFDGDLNTLNASSLTKGLFEKPLCYPSRKFFGAHAYYTPSTKFGNYSVSVPLIFSGPQIKKGYELKTPVNLTDIAPTISKLLQIPVPKQSQGKVIDEIIK